MKVVFVSGNFQKYAIEAQCDIDGVRCEFYSDQSGGHLVDRITRQTLPLTMTQLAYIKEELRRQAEDISKRVPMFQMSQEETDERMETLLERKLVDFKQKLKQLNEDALSNLYTDCLPYILTDTQFNMSRIIDGCLEKIIKGDFNVKVDQWNNYALTVVDANGFDHTIRESGDSIWGTLVQKIYEANPDAARDTYVKQLEAKIDSLKKNLNAAYGLR